MATETEASAVPSANMSWGGGLFVAHALAHARNVVTARTAPGYTSSLLKYSSVSGAAW